MSALQVVTGAFGYSGKYITARLLDAGVRVRTLTNSLKRANPFGDKIEAHPFSFNNQAVLIESLRGAAVLYNTYWARQHADTLGKHYASEIARRKNRQKAYDTL